ncbi:MAG: hypothetical protein IH623_03765 [Verrucomicrobia bacterium]|nr:hypothetical protein [Verrucomicrobiota bacterium]
MNGFAAYLANDPFDLKRGLPPELGNFSGLVHLDKGAIAFWGEGGGDIHYFQESGTTALTLSGYIYGMKGGPDFISQQEACRFIMEAIGNCKSHAVLTALLACIRGSFAMFYRDTASDTTICVSDRVSSRPLWIGLAERGWIVSSHTMAAALIMGAARFNPVGIGAFLLYGGPINPSHSVFSSVCAVPPGTVMRLLPNGRIEQQTWYAFRHEPQDRVPRAEWVDVICERLVSASATLLKHCRRPCVFFSGGTDSRLAAAALKAAGGDPLLLTLSDGPNLETRVAAMAAKALQLEHRVIIRDKHWYLRKLRRTVYETGGVYLWSHGHFALAAQEVASQDPVDVFVLGDFCEAFSKLFCSLGKTPNSLWRTTEFVRVFDSIRLPLYRPESREGTLSLLKRGIRIEVDHALQQQIAQFYEHLVTLADDPMIVGDLAFRWDAVNLLPTFFMFLDLRSAAAERNVMFDPEVHDLLQQIPATMRNGCNLGAQLIKRLSPRAAWVVNSNSLVPMCWPPTLHRSARRVKPLLGKFRRAVLGKSHRTTGSWQERAHLYLADPLWRGAVQSLLNQLDHFDEELFDRDNLRALCRHFMEGDLTRAVGVEKLLQIGMLNQMLLNGRSSSEDEGARIVDFPA